MAVVTKKSTIITNRDATPVLLTDPQVSSGHIRLGNGFVSAVSGDSIASAYIIHQIPSNARVSSMVLSCEALGALAKVDVGVFKRTQNGGAIANTASGNFFCAALDVSAALSATDITNQAGTNTLDKQEQPLWQAIGLASDPETMFDIAIIVNAAIAANGKIALRTSYMS